MSVKSKNWTTGQTSVMWKMLFPIRLVMFTWTHGCKCLKKCWDRTRCIIASGLHRPGPLHVYICPSICLKFSECGRRQWGHQCTWHVTGTKSKEWPNKSIHTKSECLLPFFMRWSKRFNTLLCIQKACYSQTLRINLLKSVGECQSFFQDCQAICLMQCDPSPSHAELRSFGLWNGLILFNDGTKLELRMKCTCFLCP